MMTLYLYTVAIENPVPIMNSHHGDPVPTIHSNHGDPVPAILVAMGTLYP